MRTLFLATLAMLSFHPSSAVAQAQSSIELKWCYAGNCTYESLADAERAMDAANPNYAGKFIGEDTSTYTPGAAQLHRTTRTYRVPDAKPVTENAPVYMPDFSPNPAPQFCAPSGDPIYPNACRTDEEFVQGYVNHYKQIYGATRVLHQVSGKYVSPFSEVVGQGTPPPGQPPRGIQRYNHDNNPILQMQVTVTVLNESGVPISGAGSTARILKFSSFVCPAGYTAKSGAHPDYSPTASVKVTGPVCVPSIEVQTITGPGLQYCTVPTNKHPCYPATGDKARFETDFEFSGRPFVRAYHALRQTGQKPEFAPGWTHSYSDRIMGTAGASKLVLIGENGYYEIFNRYGYSVRYVSPGDATRAIDVIVENNKNVFRLTGNGDLIRYFNDAGRLLRVENTTNGWKVALAYDGDRLISATDQVGQTLLFNYQDGRLASLLLPGGRTIEYGYDANRNFQSVRYADGSIRSYHYNEAGLSDANDPHALTGISDDGVRYATFAYDSKGRARLSQLHANGAATEKTTLAYNGDSSVTVTGDRGQTTTYALSSASQYRRITGTTTAAGTTTNSYTGAKVSESRDPAGNITRYEYATDGSYASARYEAYGTSVERVSRTTRNTLYQITATELQQKSGSSYVTKQRQEWTYDGTGSVRTHKTIDPATGTSRTITYDRCDWNQVAPTGPCPVARLVTGIDGPRTDVLDKTTYAYYNWDDPACTGSCSFLVGKLKRVTNALGHTVEYLGTDQHFGRPTRVRDANGVITDLEYNDRGRLTARKLRGIDDATESDDQILRIEYTPTGEVGKVTLPDGAFTLYSYDSAHRLTAITDADGNRIDAALDGGGAPTMEQVRDAQGTLLYSVSRTYTALGDVQSITDAYNHTTTSSVDANGNTDQTTDPLGRIADSNVDPLNRLTRTLQDMNGIAAETKFSYDAFDNLTQVNDPKGLNTNYTYNALGDLTRLESPDTGITLYNHDSAGNRIAQTDARGVTTTYAYDALNRITSIVSPTPALNIAYTYDTTETACQAGETFNIGRLTKIVDASGSTVYCHDRFGHMVRKVQTTNGRSFVLRYAFNVAGQPTGIVYPDGTVIDYGYDSRGRAVEVGVTPAGATRQIVLSSATYYPFGPVSQWTYGNGRVMKRGLNRNYQPGFVEVTGAGGLSVGYEFDAAGNLVRLRTADQAEPPARAYAYDGLNRLTQAKHGATDAVLEAYAYDSTGNRTSATVGGTTTAYSHAGTSHRLNAVGTTARSYDAAGNTTQIGANKSFVYDDLGRMRQVLDNGVVTRNYVYNGLGQQVRTWAAANDDRYGMYGEEGQWLGEYDHTGAPRQQIVWFSGLPVAVLTGSGTAQKLHTIEADALGTPRVIVDPTRGASGTAVWRWELTGEAFGNTAPNEDPNNDGTAFVFDMRFPGQRYDAATGLNYNYFRDYDPSTGRYTQSDPIGLVGGISTYSYVDANPAIAFDFYGLEKCIFLNGNSIWNRDKVPYMSAVNFRDRAGTMYVFAHASSRSIADDRAGGYFENNRRRLTPEQLADVLQEECGWKPNMPVVIYGCETAKGENSFAERLSSELKTEVTGFPDIISIDADHSRAVPHNPRTFP